MKNNKRRRNLSSLSAHKVKSKHKNKESVGEWNETSKIHTRENAVTLDLHLRNDASSGDYSISLFLPSSNVWLFVQLFLYSSLFSLSFRLRKIIACYCFHAAVIAPF